MPVLYQLSNATWSKGSNSCRNTMQESATVSHISAHKITTKIYIIIYSPFKIRAVLRKVCDTKQTKYM